MSEKMTRIRVPGTRIGLMDYGEKTRAEMVKQLRDYANYRAKEIKAIDTTDNADFEVDIVLGPVVQRHVRKVP